jgi:hypothetical protein
MQGLSRRSVLFGGASVAALAFGIPLRSAAQAVGLAEFNLPDALVWNVLTFTKTPGLCGGPTGYWADAPQA